MKKLITNYTFDASAKTITFGDYVSIVLDSVLLITNVTDNIIIYNFAATGKGGTVATNVLTLDYDTTSMDDADDLQIFYDDTDVNFATEETLAALNAKVTAVNTGAVVVSSSALPTGAATSANQSTIIGHVDGIEGLLTTIDADTENIATNTSNAAASLAVIDDWDETDRAKVNPIVGQAGVQGASGAVSANTQRVVLATDVALPAGTNAIGKLAANSGVDIGDVDVTSVIPGTGATNLGKAIDTATGSTDTGVLALFTRDDALTTLTPADGDNVQGRTDSKGAVWEHQTFEEDTFTTCMNAQTLQNTTETDAGTVLDVTHSIVEFEISASKTGTPTRFRVFLKWSNDGGTNYGYSDHSFEPLIWYPASEVGSGFYRCFVVPRRGAKLKFSAQAEGTASGSHYFTVTIKARARNLG